MNKPILALLYDASKRAYVAIQKFDDEWFTVGDLGANYGTALKHLEEMRNVGH
jgi:hypothetical protein